MKNKPCCYVVKEASRNVPMVKKAHELKHRAVKSIVKSSKKGW